MVIGLPVMADSMPVLKLKMPVVLNYAYWSMGSLVCEGVQAFEDNAEIELCDSKQGGLQIRLRARIEQVGVEQKEIRFEGTIVETHLLLGSTRTRRVGLVAMDGFGAEVTNGDDEGEVSRLLIRPHMGGEQP